jgi:hypothetical protein
VSWKLLSKADTNDGRPRWFEIKLFKRVIEDRVEYRVEMIGKSVVNGETDRIRTETTTSPHAVIDFLAMGEPRSRYIPKVSRKALHEAGDIDQALADALDDFDTVTAR